MVEATCNSDVKELQKILLNNKVNVEDYINLFGRFVRENYPATAITVCAYTMTGYDSNYPEKGG